MFFWNSFAFSMIQLIISDIKYLVMCLLAICIFLGRVYRTFHPKNNEFQLFLKCTRNLLQDRSHMGHKSSLGKFKKVEIFPSIFSDHNAVTLQHHQSCMCVCKCRSDADFRQHLAETDEQLCAPYPGEWLSQLRMQWFALH